MLKKLKIALLIVILAEEIRSARKLNSNDMNKVLKEITQLNDLYNDIYLKVK
ncbi:hypothetical protein [Staphylococcus hominis]|uniref:hypothetical protein n=1 Tax=Staphylococcus hominis TaxID=1290 RepID=UPI00164342A5|nr:hypothetical protein [Staphylococcus hominis]MBC2955345.1 hypothetical protein [Staphylococcus hominis]